MINKKGGQRALRATLAATLVTSGVVYTLPVQAASSPFSDVPYTHTHFDNIMALQARGVISGYGDGTFRPNKYVTRAQASKMLAMVLNLDTVNVKNPNFADVSSHDEHYGAIAALVEANVISGYGDGSFRPNATLTRSQMAKMLVNGFNFEVASAVQPVFQDVTSATSNAVHIQTLVDLGITRGTTPVTFSPYNNVTRGQISTFLMNAERANQQVKKYKITAIEGNTVYINGVPYQASRHLQSLLSSRNAAVLKDATIEAKFRGKEIIDISKLTINASGTSPSRMLVLSGNHTQLNADVVVNGNHIVFRDMTIRGTVLLNETVRPPLTQHIPLVSRAAITERNFQAGSLASANTINWGNSNSSEMKAQKNVVFENTEVQKIIVSQNATKITTNRELKHVEVIGNVEQIELQGDANYFHVNNDKKLTIFGEGTINHLQYDSLYDLQIYIDGTVNKLVVDNSFGWIDLDEHTYINEVILPPGESPNNIFDDYLEDHGNITVIEDSDGNPVDKNPVENQKPSDRTPPIMKILEVTPEGTSATVNFHTNENGTYYYIVQKKTEDMKTPPGRDFIEQKRGKYDDMGTGSMRVGENKFTATGLAEKETYVVYILGVDGAKNVSPIIQKEFQMKDATPPKVNNLKAVPMRGGQRAEVSFSPSEDGQYFVYYRKSVAGQPAATFEEIEANAQIKKRTPKDNGTQVITEMISGLSNETDYEVYVAMIDLADNKSVEPQAMTTLTTSELDNIPPYILGGELRHKSGNVYEVEISEPLDPESATKIENYRLKGTAMVNIPQHDKDGVLPMKVEYADKGNKGLLTVTVPATTALVNGDNIVLDISPRVKDLADNEFENINNIPKGIEKARNRAEYIHNDPIKPTLKLNNIIVNNDNTKAELEFTANKAGTYYYMIMPEGVNFDKRDIKIKPKDFYAEFTNDKTDKFIIDPKTGEKLYLSKEGPKPAERDKQKVDITIPKEKLDPFKSYSVYMILRDRSGNLTEIQEISLVADAKPPLVTVIPEGDKKVRPDVGDITATLRLNSNEKGRVHYILREEGQKLKDVTAAYIRTAGRAADMRQGMNDIKIAGMLPHRHYVLYVAVEDTFGNITMKESTDLIEGEDKPNGEDMKFEFFSDGTRPHFIIRKDLGFDQPVVLADEDGVTFRVTFNESIYGNNESIYDSNGYFNPARPDELAKLEKFITIERPKPESIKFASLIKEVDKDGNFELEKKPYDPRDLIIKFKEAPKEDFAVVVDKKMVDNRFAKLPFADENIAKYKYQDSKLRVSYAVLRNEDEDIVKPATSKEMTVLVEGKRQGKFLNLYYVVINDKVENIKPKHVKNNENPNEANNKFQIHGKSELGDVATQLQLTAPNNQVFKEDQWIYMVTEDEYGTLIMPETPTQITSKTK
ncbi:S-layer protein precursor [Metalysinibacillus saudimassiliensis]|uniref:S-layer protein n=1 Tax=Metalysinibacillus saudimassiliensis TaxID=1461583 RepID=A0A078M7A4_9BACL|nr:S-layer protein precursor [Metalysinibacillus saudimassiliensis]